MHTYTHSNIYTKKCLHNENGFFLCRSIVFDICIEISHISIIKHIILNEEQDYDFYNIGVNGKLIFVILSFVNICNTWIIYANWSLCFGKCSKLVCLQSLYH